MMSQIITLFLIAQSPLPSPTPSLSEHPPSTPPSIPPDTAQYFLYWMIPTLSALSVVLLILFYLAIRPKLPSCWPEKDSTENSTEVVSSKIELSVLQPSERKIKELSYSRR